MEETMTKRSKKPHKSEVNLEGYVVVAFAEDIDQAKEYKSLLEASDINAIIREQGEQVIGSPEIAVMVPEEYIDEAHVVIESQHAYDDFYDFAMEGEDESDFDGDFLDDDF